MREAFETEILSNPSITFVPFFGGIQCSKERGRFFDKGKRTARSVRTEYRKQGNGEKIEKVYRCQSLLITTGGFAGPKLAVMAADMHLLKYLDMRL